VRVSTCKCPPIASANADRIYTDTENKIPLILGALYVYLGGIYENLPTSMNLLCFSTEVCKFIIEQDACFGGENSGSKSEKQEQ